MKVSSSVRFSSPSSVSSLNDSRTGLAKPATSSLKRACNQGSEGAKGRVKTKCRYCLNKLTTPLNAGSLTLHGEGQSF